MYGLNQHTLSGIAQTESRRTTELEYILLGDLRDQLEDQLDPQATHWVVAVIDALLKAIPERHQIVSQDGYLGEVVTEFPNWAAKVENLELQHFALYDRLSDLRDQLKGSKADDHTLNLLRFELQMWMESYTKHKRHESQLLQTAINLEVGGG